MRRGQTKLPLGPQPISSWVANTPERNWGVENGAIQQRAKKSMNQRFRSWGNLAGFGWSSRRIHGESLTGQMMRTPAASGREWRLGQECVPPGSAKRCGLWLDFGLSCFGLAGWVQYLASKIGRLVHFTHEANLYSRLCFLQQSHLAALQ